MQHGFRGVGIGLCWLAFLPQLRAQEKVVDSVQVKCPTRPKLVIETDQRFSCFTDSRSRQGNLRAVNVWGARIGLLFPNNVKTGVGFYYATQLLTQSAMIPDIPMALHRRMVAGTLYLEPYWIRRKLWELSTPVEAGLGRAVYQGADPATQRSQTQRGWFVPFGAGLSVSLKFPELRGLRPLRWFGLNLLSGYRLILKRDFPGSRVNYNGLYFSVGPTFFFDRFTGDFKVWQQRMRTSKAARRAGEK